MNKKCFLKIVNCLLSVVLSIGLFVQLSVPVQAASGKSGNVNWNLENGVLTISGSGAMADYVESSDRAPWYEYRKEITKVIIENGVTHIGESAFFECTSLKSVTMANSVKSIGPLAFLKCKNLESVQLSSNLQTIGQGAFKQCESLTLITLPNGVKTIEAEAFFDCESLKTITVPSSVTTLGMSVFTYCDSLIQVNMNANISVLPAWTFYGCTSLTNISLPKSIEDVGSDAFNNCKSLDKVSGDVSEEVLNKIETQTNDSIINDSFVDTNHKSDEVVENEDIIFNGTFDEDEVVINATIKNDDGWDTVIDKTDDYISVKDNLDIDKNVQVNVTVDGSTIDGSVINEFAGKDIDLVIKGDYEVKIPCNLLDPNQNYSSFKVGYTLTPVDKLSKNMINVIGDKEAFTLKFNGSGNLKMTVKVSLGSQYAYQTASIYQREGSGYNFIQTVEIDGNGYASFYFESFDNYTTYLIGINVNTDNVLIPEENSGTLMDEHGNKYAITGVKSKWGIDLGQLTMIVIGVLVLVIGLVGGSMFMINKRNQTLAKIREEVMSESYSKEENIKNYKTTKKKLFEKKKK